MAVDMVPATAQEVNMLGIRVTSSGNNRVKKFYSVFRHRERKQGSWARSGGGLRSRER